MQRSSRKTIKINSPLLVLCLDDGCVLGAETGERRLFSQFCVWLCNDAGNNCQEREGIKRVEILTFPTKHLAEAASILGKLSRKMKMMVY